MQQQQQQQSLFLSMPSVPGMANMPPAMQPFLCGNCEAANASSRCLQCDEDCAFLCHDCAGKHNQMKAFRRHEIVLLSDYVMMTNNFHQNQMMNRLPSKLDHPYQQYDPSMSLNPQVTPPYAITSHFLCPILQTKRRWVSLIAVTNISRLL